MKILYATDLHGDRDRYRRVEELTAKLGVAAVVNGGDLLPHLHPILKVQRRFIEEDLARHVERLAAAGIQFLSILGNDDLAACDETFRALCARFPTAHPLAGARVALGGYEFIGFDLVADYPFRLKDRCRRDREDFVLPPQRGTAILSSASGLRELPNWPKYVNSLPTIEEELARLPAPEDPLRAVYVIHHPPAGVGLDCCADGRRVGSRAVHRFIQKPQPRLTLHGHIHESPEMTKVWCARIGRTVAIQPGSRKDLIGVLIDLETLSAVLRDVS